MSVPRFTTPTFTLIFSEPDLDFTQAKNVYVTFRSKAYSITKSGNDLDIEQKQIDVYLTQRETSKFDVGDLEIQANWLTPDNKRASSEVMTCRISDQLLQRVIE